MGSNIYFAVVMALCIIKRCYSQELTITKLQRNGNQILELCFENGKGVELDSVKYYQLVIIDTKDDPVVERPITNEEENVNASTKCVTFANSELQDYAGEKGIFFILTGRKQDDTEVVFGTAQLEMPCFPENEADSVTAYYVGTKDDTSLRVNDHTKPTSGKTWTITYDGGVTNLDCYYPADGNKVPCFVIGGLEDVEEDTSLLMCLEVNTQVPAGGTVSVCGKTFTPKKLPAEGPSLTQVSLSYASPNLALDANLENDAHKIDIVLYNESDRNIQVNKDLKATVSLENYDPVFKTYKILLVGLNNNKDTEVRESNLIFFQDFRVHAQDLSAGSHILEVQWKKTKDQAKYSLTRSKLDAGDGGSFTQTTVNCPGNNGTFCYGYFVELSPGGYDVTFKPLKEDGVENLNNVIVSKSATIAKGIKTKKNKIIINTVNITWNLQDEAVVILCFEYLEESSYTEYDYEAIIINNEGQWRRDKMFLPAEKGIICSMGITMPSDQFKRHSVLTGAVVTRHPNGSDIIQSGYVTFELS